MTSKNTCNQGEQLRQQEQHDQWQQEPAAAHGSNNAVLRVVAAAAGKQFYQGCGRQCAARPGPGAAADAARECLAAQERIATLKGSSSALGQAVRQTQEGGEVGSMVASGGPPGALEAAVTQQRLLQFQQPH
ncbi:hypothetical protein N2152v2_006825 [Parachlorella kessleri]